MHSRNTLVEKLEKYISDLLWKHDCVVVPGFGGFVLNQQPAQFSASSHELHPQGKRVSFNRSLVNNDGLLHHYISQVTGQSFAGAQSFVTTQLNYWKLQLLNKKPVSLAGLGTLQADVEGRWVFTPEDLVYSKTAYGLGSLQLTPLEAAPAIHIRPKKEKAAVPARAGRRRVWLRRSIAAVGIACLLAVAGYFLAPGLSDMPQLASFNFWESADSPDAPAVKPVQEPVPAGENTEPVRESSLSASVDTYVPSYKFYVIGGSFAQEKNAERFRDELEQKGYQSEVLHNENGFFRVAYIYSADSLAANQELQKIKTEENQEAWLLKW